MTANMHPRHRAAKIQVNILWFNEFSFSSFKMSRFILWCFKAVKGQSKSAMDIELSFNRKYLGIYIL